MIQNCYFTYNVCSNNGVNGGGGGAYIRVSGIISNCIFVTNTDLGDASVNTRGGGIHLGSGSGGYVLNCYFISNASFYQGGGIAKDKTCDGVSVISNCFFSAIPQL